MAASRYDRDVLAPGWQQAHRRVSVETPVSVGLVVEEPTSGFVGAVVRWENGLVVLEDRKGARRSFPFGPGFWIDGSPVDLRPPARSRPVAATHNASGSRVAAAAPAKVARASRIYVEGWHDAELVEKIWGDDLRVEGVVVEYLGGIDDLPAIVDEFAPGPRRRLGVLVDHLVTGTKETRIVDQVRSGSVLVTGHPFIDIWTAIRPERAGLAAWPEVPRGIDYKTGLSRALGRPASGQADIAQTWRWLLGRVRDWRDLDPALPREVERLIDFVTTEPQDH
ncbi:MAG: DUF3097 family protein [Propionicimonas sp.]|uniref:DUF3097 family protein n=1 Tax=Propionicimonas sp. TaxID=1955623 RepID=UPI002B2047A3|nr:DUF3097 family protein [Propionicimonas sp.]MEA4945042.1 DUF3097 family protein [Propionicimonas sp.]MEA5052701.1 DUF3097 family protein [Propionicimonas sp.]MEA5119370.1 DUF3097 family protein [Propionicimonas sp.]